MGLLQNLTGWHALIVLVVILLFFGAAKLPALAKSVGQSARILKSEAAEASAPASASAAAVRSAEPAVESAAGASVGIGAGPVADDSRAAQA